MYNNSNEFFGKIEWCNEDIANALEMQEKPITEENIIKIRNKLENHFFTDYLIQQGWDYIYGVINTELK